jgi:excisionase family DNA binding protein
MTWKLVDYRDRRRAWPIKEGAYQIGIGRSLVYKLAATGKIRLIKVGNRTLIPEEEIIRLTTAEGER